MKIGIVADTSSNFSPKTAQQLGIHIVPMQIIIDNQTYRDGIDISVEDFYQKMEKAKILPTTSQPAIGEFIRLYQDIENQYDKIISIHPASKLSGTVETAQMAANQVNPEKITVFDSELVSILTGYIVKEAQRLINEGKAFEVIMSRLTEMKTKTMAYVMLENFDNLIRSGRLSHLAGKLTRLAQIKPIIKISSAGIELKRLVRTSSRALEKLEEISFDYMDSLDYPAKIDVAHGNILELANTFKDKLSKKLPDQRSEIHRLSSVIGVHTGPEIIGFTFTPDYIDK